MRCFSVETTRKYFDAEDDSLFELFRNCPALRCFKFHYPYPFNQSPLPPKEPIELYRLSQFDLELTPLDLSLIISSIQTPKSMTPVLKVVVSPGTKKEDCAIRLPADPRCLPSLNTITSLTVNYRDSSITAILGGSKKRTALLVFSSSTTSVSARDATHATLRLLSKRHQFSSLKILSISEWLGYHADEEDITFLISIAPELSSINLKSPSFRLLSRIVLLRNHSSSPFLSSLKHFGVSNYKGNTQVIHDLCNSVSGIATLTCLKLQDLVFWNGTGNETREEIKRMKNILGARLEFGKIYYYPDPSGDRQQLCLDL